MRSKKKIEGKIEEINNNSIARLEALEEHSKISLEILLDIRDLLIQIKDKDLNIRRGGR